MEAFAVVAKVRLGRVSLPLARIAPVLDPAGNSLSRTLAEPFVSERLATLMEPCRPAPPPRLYTRLLFATLVRASAPCPSVARESLYDPTQTLSVFSCAPGQIDARVRFRSLRTVTGSFISAAESCVTSGYP